MRHRLNLLREFSVPLLAGVVLAVVWANLDPAGYHSFNSAPFIGGLSFHFISNELFMVLFFGIAAVEITQSFLPGGDLNPVSNAVNPLLGTLGGVIGPVVVYTCMNIAFGSAALNNGWGIPTATDIALAWLVARMIFGAGHPAVSYLLLLAVTDDAIGLAIIAIFYPNPTMPVEPVWLLLIVLGMGIAWFMRRLNLRNYWPYLLIGGSLSWSGLYHAHLHPALALVFIIPFLPHAKKEHKHLFDEDRNDRTPLARFEHEWKVVVDFGLFMFSLSNAGVQFSNMGTVTWLVFVSLIAGKAIGIFGFGWLASRLGFRLPQGMKLGDLLTAGMIAGTGFTVALFVAGEAFADPGIRGAAKMGAIFSLAAACLALVLAKITGVVKRT
ncbi:MAG: Na+/H+ antiporter NhaA [Proteobacteria bacterium]|nr:Na+/H+ antiporter NhaA [Pseudomonadota bacterium]